MSKERFHRDSSGRTVGKTTTHGNSTSHHYTTYTGTRTPRERTGTSKHNGSRTTYRPR